MAYIYKPLPKRAKRTPFSPSYRREELCFCTEELGSESISCRSVMETGITVMQPQGHHRSLQTCSYHERNVLSADGKCTLQPVGLRCKASKPLHLSTDMPACQAASRSVTREVTTAQVRTFPPPISSLLSERPIMRSFKCEGRFLLQRVNTPSSSPFRSVREDGRLRLILLSSSSALDCWSEDQAKEDAGQSKTATDVQEGLHKAEKEPAQEGTKMSFHCRTLCMPARSMLFGSSCGWHSTASRSGACRYLPTLRLLLEKAQRFNYNVQTSANGSLITARECKDMNGAHCHLQDKALQHKLKSNAPLITSSGRLQLLAGNGRNQFSSTLKLPCVTARSSSCSQLEKLQHESNAICYAPANAVEAKKEDGYAILSLSFNDLVLLVVLEGTKSWSMAIKGADTCHNYSNAQGAASSAGSRGDQYADKQPCSGSKGLSYYNTWHPSKPIDFRIAA